MHHFFVDPSSIEEGIVRIVGTDLNHMKNVLRMKPGEEVLISDGTGKERFLSVLCNDDGTLGWSGFHSVLRR